jgi:hypothetical protein
LVAGDALTQGGEWRAPKRGFLFPVKVLSKVFRGKFIARLETLCGEKRWPVDALPTGAMWRDLKRALYAHDWVVYAKQPLGGPAQVLVYLGRYTHRVAISNEPIIGIDDEHVAFRVRADPASGTKRTLRLPGPVFIDRFYCMSCRRASSGFGTTGSWRQPTRLSVSMRHDRRWRCQHLRSRYSNPSRASSGEWPASTGRCVPVAGKDASSSPP